MPPARTKPVAHALLSNAGALMVLCYACLLALHAGLLRLPYFWDEAGYYIPAARDLLLSGSLIPHSTVSNAHPPLLLAFLALAWKLFGYAPMVTRCAMLLVAAFALVGVFRLASHVANTEVAIASVVSTALYPVFFAQSSLAHLDLAAAALLLWGLDYYLRDRRTVAVALFSLAAVTKETTILVPLALSAWEAILQIADRRSTSDNRQSRIGNFFRLVHPEYPLSAARSAMLLVPLVLLAGWFAFHYAHTGHVFGNPQFFQYNLTGTLSPLRFLAALALRLWQLFGYMNMLVMTAALLIALTLPPLTDPTSARRKAHGNGDPELPRRRIALPVQAVFAVVVAAHLVALSVLGGAVLARYLLPVYPLVIVLAVSTLRRRLPWWPAFVGLVCLGFLLGLIIEPPYRFAPEDSLAYADYVRLHQAADVLVEQRFPHERVLTAWPASDELTRPWLGYVSKPIPVLTIENFSASQLFDAAQARSQYQVALLFSTKEEPRLLLRARWWERIQARFFDYHRDLQPAEAARLLGGRIVFERHRRSQWVALIRLESIENARLTLP